MLSRFLVCCVLAWSAVVGGQMSGPASLAYDLTLLQEATRFGALELAFPKACAAHLHVVGEGAQGTEVVAARQFYVVSLAPLNKVDTRAMAGGAEDYTIKTAAGFVDILITAVTSGIITSRKVVVVK